MAMRSDVRIYSGIFLIILAALAVIIFAHRPGTKPPVPISSFDDCVKAGYPVMQSYPPQCALPNGKFFVQRVVPQ